MDFSIDLGGCVETSRPMSLSDPTFVAEGVTHFCVPNLPAAVARTSSHALTNAALPYILRSAHVAWNARWGSTPRSARAPKCTKARSPATG